MPSPLTVVRNDYHKNKKRSDIFTPKVVCDFLYSILQANKTACMGGWPNTVLDPAVGSGNLLKPFVNSRFLVGYDIVDAPDRISSFMFIQKDFLTEDKPIVGVELVICNPPFNQTGKGRKLMPELFAKKIFELYGYTIPLVLFTPMGFRLNQRKKSSRWRFFRDCGAKITSIVSLPLDIFPDVEFHNEILLWNMPDLNAHYWLPENL